jgi:outer membrane protein assembly factor BamA
MKRRRRLIASAVLALAFACRFLLPVSIFAQEPTVTQAGSRSELIEDQRKDKAKDLSPAKPDGVEQALEKYIGEDPLNKYLGSISGLRLKLGGLPSGGGFAIGPEYYRTGLLKGQMHFRASATGSQKLWYEIDTELRFPHLAVNYLDLDISGRRLDANSMAYYGPGPDSDKAQRTNYRREENALNASLSLKPTRRYLSLGVVAGYLWLNTGPGQSDLYASSEEQFSPEAAPGIDQQTNYMRAGLFLDVDSRDQPSDPHAGTHFRVELSRFSDRKFDQYSFQQIESSIEHYLPFFNGKRVIALRALSVLSYPLDGNRLPFYMQPTLGGSSDLRGYQRYRFYDDNSFAMNAEYRWEIFTVLDAAVFADAGKVFHRDGDFGFEHLESDAGFGFRFKTRHHVAFRIDTAFSHEGYGIWLAFDPIF